MRGCCSDGDAGVGVDELAQHYHYLGSPIRPRRTVPSFRDSPLLYRGAGVPCRNRIPSPLCDKREDILGHIWSNSASPNAPHTSSSSSHPAPHPHPHPPARAPQIYRYIYRILAALRRSAVANTGSHRSRPAGPRSQAWADAHHLHHLCSDHQVKPPLLSSGQQPGSAATMGFIQDLANRPTHMVSMGARCVCCDRL